MKGDHGRIHGRADAVEYYTPEYIMTPVRSVLGGIDYDPASNELANTLVQATRYSSDPGYIDLVEPCSNNDNSGRVILPYRYFYAGGMGELWNGRVWLNHPFGRDEKACKPLHECRKTVCHQRGYHLAKDKPGSYRWIQGLVQSYELGKKITGGMIAAATITFSNTDTDWFGLLLPYPQVYLYSRVNFMTRGDGGELVRSPGSTKGATITFFGCDIEVIYENFRELGELKLAHKGRR